MTQTLRTVGLLVRKEIVQVLRDRLMRVQILLPPLLQLLVLSHAATFEVRHTPVAVVDDDRSGASRRLVEAFTATGRFGVAGVAPTMAAAERALDDGTARLVLRVPRGLERDLRRRGAARVQLVLNAEDGAAAGVVQSYAMGILDGFAAREGVRLRAGAARAGPRLDVRARGWFNPRDRYLDFMALGFLALLVTIVGTLVTAQNLAREKERGTLEQLNATPVTRGQFIAGKLLPFWLLGLVEFTLGLAIIKLAFGTPFAGSLAVVYLGVALYLVAALGLGLLLSTVAETQQQAMFVTYFALLIYLFLSGLFTPVESMPPALRVLAEANPIRHLVVVVRGVLLKGATLPDVAPHLAALAALAAALFGLAVARTRKTTA